MPLVEADEPRLGQLFLNVVTNALQALEENASGEDNEIRVCTRTAPDGAAVVEIADNGPGIRADILGRLFEPFFSTKAAGVGTGLGLPICRSIVAALGGTIIIESEVGRGTTCRVTLPARSVAVARPGTPPPAPPAAVSRRVLVVDDEPALLKMLAEELGREHEVRIASSGSEAIELVLGEAFDVVLCDVMMPSTSGIDVYEAARRRRPGLEQRFVFMTAGAYTANARAFLASVPNKKLEKPFSYEELLGAIYETGAERR